MLKIVFLLYLQKAPTHPDLKTRGSQNLLDSQAVANLISTFKPKGENWLYLMIDFNEDLGESLRIAAYGGFCLLAVASAPAIRNFFLQNWFGLLVKLGI